MKKLPIVKSFGRVAAGMGLLVLGGCSARENSEPAEKAVTATENLTASGTAAAAAVVNFGALPAPAAGASARRIIHRHVQQPLGSGVTSSVGTSNPALLFEPAASQATSVTAAAIAAAPAAAPLVSFEGQSDTGWAPPDTNGAVSSQYVVSTVNNRITVRNRTGIQLSSVDLDTFWAPISTPSSFDTRIRFDPYGQRFILMSAGSLGDSANSSLLLAVSQTNNPTGNWSMWRIKVDPANVAWLDHPTIGFNKNWVVVSGNIIGGNPSTVLWVFTKSSLYAGTLSYRTLPGLGWTTQPAETYDATLNDEYLLWLNGDTATNVYRLTGAIGSEQVIQVATVNAPLGWTGPPDAPQAGSSQGIEAGIDWMMDCVYRNGSIWGSHEVQPLSGPTRSAIQWWRLSTAGALQDFGRIDDTSGNFYYGMASLAVNKNNDVVLGYTRFSAGTYPSAGYAVRLGTDPAGQFRAGHIYKAGAGPYGGDRWGDYSHTQVDPVNDVNMWTVQEYSTGAGWDTWWADVVPTDLSCSTNADCDDGVFCNGTETCTSSKCKLGTSYGQACINATPLAPFQNSGSIGTAERWFVVSADINGWQASNLGSRTLRVNGVVVTSGQMPLPAKVGGQRYFQFSAGTPDFTSLNFW